MEAICKECGYKMVAYDQIEGTHTAPREGDFCVCAGCGTIHIAKGEDLVVAAIEELEDLKQKQPGSHALLLIIANEFRKLRTVKEAFKKQEYGG